MFKSTMAIVFATLLLGGPAAADVYACTFTEMGKSNYIPKELVLKYDADTADVMVNGPVIHYYNGAPVEGVLRSSNTKRLLFGWTLRRMKNSSGQYAAGMTFALNIIRATGQAQITAAPDGYDNDFRGKGSCALQ